MEDPEDTIQERTLETSIPEVGSRMNPEVDSRLIPEVESRYLSVTTVVSFSLVTDSLFLRFLVTRVKPDSFQKEDKADADRDDTRPYDHCRVLVLHQSIPVLLLQGRHRFDPEG
jgi:hypothetical protein